MVYSSKEWDVYRKLNEKFCDQLLNRIGDHVVDKFSPKLLAHRLRSVLFTCGRKKAWSGFGPVVIANDMCSELLLYSACF